MSLATNLVVIITAVALCACSVGVRRSEALRVPAGGPQNAGDMVATWDARKQAETRCPRGEADRQIDRKNNDRSVSPACGDYKP